MKKGIDISHHQGVIDFDSVRKSGVEFVIIREGYGQNVDSRFLANVEACKTSGLEIKGVYHFMYPLSSEDARKEAQSCITNVKSSGLDLERIFIFSDFEYDTVSKAASKGVLLNRPECNLFTLEFCRELQRLGCKHPGIYTNLDYYKNWYTKDVLESYDIWLADYKDGPDFECSFQQYSSTGSIPGIKGNVDLDYCYLEDSDLYFPEKAIRSRNEVIRLANSWVGKNEKDGSYKEIIDIYNTLDKELLPRKLKMQYDWSWCACFWSALAIKLGYTDIIPIEISCGFLIEAAKKMGIWEENDGYIPKPGDAVLYDWDDSGVGNNVGWPDHVGVVEYVNEDASYFVVIEGNYNDSVKKRTVSINGKYIRGFITPKYMDDTVINESSNDLEVIAKEVISGLWGNGEERKKALTASGYDYEKVQKMVNQILNETSKAPKNQDYVSASCYAKKFDNKLSGMYKTTENLYCRNDAGTNKKALCLIPKNKEVTCYGYYSLCGNEKWLYITFSLDGIVYTGFSSEKYLKKR